MSNTASSSGVEIITRLPTMALMDDRAEYNVLVVDSDAHRRADIAAALSPIATVIECRSRKDIPFSRFQEQSGVIRSTRSLLACAIVAQQLDDFGSYPNDWRDSEGITVIARLKVNTGLHRYRQFDEGGEEAFSPYFVPPTQCLIFNNLPSSDPASDRKTFAAVQALDAQAYCAKADVAAIAAAAPVLLSNFQHEVARWNGLLYADGYAREHTRAELDLMQGPNSFLQKLALRPVLFEKMRDASTNSYIEKAQRTPFQLWERGSNTI